MLKIDTYCPYCGAAVTIELNFVATDNDRDAEPIEDIVERMYTDDDEYDGPSDAEMLEPLNAPPTYTEGNYPCDGPGNTCPYDAYGGMDCRNYCGLGV